MLGKRSLPMEMVFLCLSINYFFRSRKILQSRRPRRARSLTHETKRSGFIKEQIKTFAIGHVKKKKLGKDSGGQAFNGACTWEISALYCALVFFSLFLIHFSLEKKNVRWWPADCFEDGHPHFTSRLLNERAKIRETCRRWGAFAKGTTAEISVTRWYFRAIHCNYSILYIHLIALVSCASQSSSVSTCHLCTCHIIQIHIISFITLISNNYINI